MSVLAVVFELIKKSKIINWSKFLAQGVYKQALYVSKLELQKCTAKSLFADDFCKTYIML